jgi:hypothetical protein
MEQIKDTLAKIMQDWGVRLQGGRPDDPETLLKKILTKKEFRHIKLKYFKQGVLTLTVESSSWLYYFSLKKEELLRDLRQQSEKIKDLRFYIGETP